MRREGEREERMSAGITITVTRRREEQTLPPPLPPHTHSHTHSYSHAHRDAVMYTGVVERLTHATITLPVYTLTHGCSDSGEKPSRDHAAFRPDAAFQFALQSLPDCHRDII